MHLSCFSHFRPFVFPLSQHPRTVLIPRHAPLPTQPLVEVMQEEADALVVAWVQFQQL
jgi:hypothetical protein